MRVVDIAFLLKPSFLTLFAPAPIVCAQARTLEVVLFDWGTGIRTILIPGGSAANVGMSVFKEEWSFTKSNMDNCSPVNLLSRLDGRDRGFHKR